MTRLLFSIVQPIETVLPKPQTLALTTTPTKKGFHTLKVKIIRKTGKNDLK